MTAPFALRSPCVDCPFRSDTIFHLDPRRAHEIAAALLDDKSFHCHKTVDYRDDGETDTSNAAHCAGALIILEKLDQPNQIMRIGERVGFYDPTQLEMDSPVFDNLDEWCQAIDDLDNPRRNP